MIKPIVKEVDEDEVNSIPTKVGNNRYKKFLKERDGLKSCVTKKDVKLLKKIMTDLKGQLEVNTGMNFDLRDFASSLKFFQEGYCTVEVAQGIEDKLIHVIDTYYTGNESHLNKFTRLLEKLIGMEMKSGTYILIYSINH